MEATGLPPPARGCHIRHMIRQMRFLLACGLAAFPAMSASAQPYAAVLTDPQQATIQQVSAYLNGLTSLKARFLQIGQDEKTASGMAWMVRPGRMRFAYDPPTPLLLVAGHGQVVFRDNQLDQTTTIPLNQSPLGLLLRDRITLTGDVTVTDFQTPPGQIQMTLVRTASPGDGSLTLFLNARPLILAGWSVVDAEGRETRIRLTDIMLGGTYPDSLFTFTDPDAGNTP